jgi:hypothetical protein
MNRKDEKAQVPELSKVLVLSEIKARVAQSTPGPWHPAKAGSKVWDESVDYTSEAEDDSILDEKNREILGSSEWIRVKWEDLEFMAHARDDVEKLIAEVERLRAILDT